MSREPELLRLQLPTLPGSEAVARHACAALAKGLRLPEETIDAVRIGISEAVGDGVRRQGDGSGMIEVVAFLRAELEFLVSDGAIDLEADELSRRLIEDATSSYAVRKRPDGGVELELRFPAARE